MTAALITNSTLPSTNNRTTIIQGIKTSLTQAGITTLTDEFNDANFHYLVYEIVLSPGKAKGTVYLYIRVSTGLTVYQKFGLDYDSAAKTFSAESVEASNTFGTLDIEVTAIAHPEVKLLILRQVNEYIYLGYVRPQHKPDWWDEANYPYCFLPKDEETEYYYSFHTTNSPYNQRNSTSTTYSYHAEYPTSLTYANPGGLVDFLPICFLGAPEDKGNSGMFGADINYASGASMGVGDEVVVTAGVEEYFVLGVHNARNAMIIRSV